MSIQSMRKTRDDAFAKLAAENKNIGAIVKVRKYIGTGYRTGKIIAKGDGFKFVRVNKGRSITIICAVNFTPNGKKGELIEASFRSIDIDPDFISN